MPTCIHLRKWAFKPNQKGTMAKCRRIEIVEHENEDRSSEHFPECSIAGEIRILQQNESRDGDDESQQLE